LIRTRGLFNSGRIYVFIPEFNNQDEFLSVLNDNEEKNSFYGEGYADARKNERNAGRKTRQVVQR
jgi:hypothetical protein